MFEELKRIIREYLLRKLVGEVDRDSVLKDAVDKVAGEIVETGLTPEDEAYIDSLLDQPTTP